MGSLINFPGLQMPTPWVLPSVYTPAVIERMGRANEVARRLRGLGYRILAEDPIPDDGGPAILQIDTGTIGTRPLQHLGGCAMRNTATGIESTTVDGVRVIWRIAEAS